MSTNINANLGPTFISELTAANLLGKPFSFGLGANGYVLMDSSMNPTDVQTLWAVIQAHNPTKQPPVEPPDNPTLGDWRVGLALWAYTSNTGTTSNWLTQVTSVVEALKAGGNPMGLVAEQRLEYSNNVSRATLLSIKDLFGFSTAQVDESLWRADRVSKGDLSGVWPLTSNTSSS